jgi:hypothetical protein
MATDRGNGVRATFGIAKLNLRYKVVTPICQDHDSVVRVSS